jgi:hypothetical protein
MNPDTHVNRFESEPARRAVFVCKDGPSGGENAVGTARPLTCGGYELRHKGQWLSGDEMKAEGFEVLVIHVRHA